MRWPIGVLALLLGLIPAQVDAQLVYRNEVTMERLTAGADIVVFGEIGRIETFVQADHEGYLVPITPDRILKGPEDPGPMKVFTFARTSATVSFEEGEKPLLFLKALRMDDLRCSHCGKEGLAVLDLPEGNYYLVAGGKWGKLLPGDVYSDHVGETIRLRQEGDFEGLKDHWMNTLEGSDDRMAIDGAIDLLAEEKAVATVNAEDSATLISLLQVDGKRLQPIEPLIALVGRTGLPEALPPLMELVRSERSPELATMADAFSRLAAKDVPVVGAVKAELDSSSTPTPTKRRFVLIAGIMEERGLTDSLIALTQEAELRKTVLIALGDLKDPKGLPTLVRLLGAGEMPDRQAAAVGLAYLGPEGVAALKEFQSAHPDDDLSRFIGELRRSPRRVRERVSQG